MTNVCLVYIRLATGRFSRSEFRSVPEPYRYFSVFSVPRFFRWLFGFFRFFSENTDSEPIFWLIPRLKFYLNYSLLVNLYLNSVLLPKIVIKAIFFLDFKDLEIKIALMQILHKQISAIEGVLRIGSYDMIDIKE